MARRTCVYDSAAHRVKEYDLSATCRFDGYDLGPDILYGFTTLVFHLCRYNGGEAEISFVSRGRFGLGAYHGIQVVAALNYLTHHGARLYFSYSLDRCLVWKRFCAKNFW